MRMPQAILSDQWEAVGEPSAQLLTACKHGSQLQGYREAFSAESQHVCLSSRSCTEVLPT